jgi:hypothetical protein
MDSFEMHSGRELWLVFRDEGKSLQDWMYNRWAYFTPTCCTTFHEDPIVDGLQVQGLTRTVNLLDCFGFRVLEEECSL